MTNSFAPIFQTRGEAVPYTVLAWDLGVGLNFSIRTSEAGNFRSRRAGSAFSQKKLPCGRPRYISARFRFYLLFQLFYSEGEEATNPRFSDARQLI